MNILQNIFYSGGVYETKVGGFEYWKLNFYTYNALN
jgi:hypothetical protein